MTHLGSDFTMTVGGGAVAGTSSCAVLDPAAFGGHKQSGHGVEGGLDGTRPSSSPSGSPAARPCRWKRASA